MLSGHACGPGSDRDCLGRDCRTLPPMRNSVMPLVGMVLIAALAVWLIPPTEDTGRDGPQIHSGILRLPTDGELRLAEVPIQTTTEVLEATGGAPPPGLEPEDWRIVAIAIEDTLPLTRAVALGLGERLTELGAVVIYDVLDEPVLPSPPDRILRIGSRQVEPKGETIQGEISIRQTSVRMPAWHPAAGLQGAASVQERTWHIRHRNEAGTATWPERWAGSGRELANLVLTDLGVAERLPGDWDRARPVAPSGRYLPYGFAAPQMLWILVVVPVFLVVRLVAGRHRAPQPGWRGHWHRLRPWGIAAALTVAIVMSSGPHRLPPSGQEVPLSAWKTHLPLPPNLAVLRWQGCFEDDLVRGWVGRIEGKQTQDRLKRPIESIQPLLKLLSKKQADDGTARAEGDGLWREEQSPVKDGKCFGRNRDGVDEFLLAVPDATGWDCVLWQEQPRSNSLQDSWVQAVEDGEHVAIARRKLRRHLTATRIPEDQQDNARALLRKDPDALEVAMIAETPAATDGERAYAAAARWILGRHQGPPPAEGPWPRLERGTGVSFDGRSVLLGLDGTLALVCAGFNDLGEIIIRDAAGTATVPFRVGEVATVTAPGGASLSIGPGLVLTYR